jgi:hypothetical protein
MSSAFRLRLLLDFLALALIVACLAYWWLDNLSHELFGTALFVLVIGHNVFNRRWYSTVAKSRRNAARWFNIVTIVCLALAMAIMLVTSLLISRDLFSFLALDGAFSLREIHMFSAYWLLLIVAMHLGTRWAVIMNTCRTTFGIRQPSVIRTSILRVAAFGISIWGARSVSEMAFGSKLALTYSLDMWDFNESTIGFFINYGSIVGMIAAAAHYLLLLFTRRGGSACKTSRARDGQESGDIVRIGPTHS